jgi:hypothetical protein
MAEWKRKKIPGHTPEREQAEKLGFALESGGDRAPGRPTSL